MKTLLELSCVAAAVALPSVCGAYEFRVRFVQRVGSNDIELPGGNTLYGDFGADYRVRVQFGVFDDAAGPAPAGGYIGWNVGTITVNGIVGNSDEFRNSRDGVHSGVGRLSPFNFAPASDGANGLPAGDPFEALTSIDNTLGQQALVWNFGSPQPQPIIRGFNTWVSTFEFSSIVNAGGVHYSIDFGGNLISALEWRTVGEPIEPTPNVPGSVAYAPVTDEQRTFSATFVNLSGPIPGAGTSLALGAALLIRRRRYLRKSVSVYSKEPFMRQLGTVATLALLAAAAPANAYEFRVRFVERIGTADVELWDGNTLNANPGDEHRIRVQFGVFDDAAGPAPAGGYIGWNVGTITVNGGAGNSDEFRNSSQGVHNGVGRLSPFNFSPASGGANGLPAGDPFEALTAIDNTLGQQAFVWNFGSPQPQPVSRGFNTWVSTFEFSTTVNAGGANYSIDFGGNLISALEWRAVGEPIEPTPDEPGSVTYAPFADQPRAFTASFYQNGIPAPGAGAMIALGAVLRTRRRR